MSDFDRPTWDPAPDDDSVFRAGSPENIEALKKLLVGWRCCGAPGMCGARCQDDPVSASLAWAERELRSAG